MTRSRPWANNATTLDTDVSDADAIRVSGLDWEVELREVAFRLPAVGDMPAAFRGEIPVYRAAVRSDSRKAIGMVTERFKPFQNRSMFDMLRGVADAAPERKLRWEAAGSNASSTLVWALARVEGLTLNVRGDEIVPYLMVTNGHVGNAALRLMPTLRRPTCENMLAAIMNRAQKLHGRLGDCISAGWRIYHDALMAGRITEAVNAYRSAVSEIGETQEAWEFLADRPLSDPAWERMMSLAMASGKVGEHEEAAVRRIDRNMARKESLNTLLASGTNQTAATKGTMFGALNALTEYVDHEAGQDAARWNSSSFGPGATLKAEAFTLAMELAHA